MHSQYLLVLLLASSSLAAKWWVGIGGCREPNREDDSFSNDKDELLTQARPSIF